MRTMHITRIRILALLIVSVLFAACAYHSADEGTPGTNPNISWTEQGLTVLGCNGGPDCQVYDACVTGGLVICNKGHCTGVNNTRADFQCVIDVYERYTFAPPTTPTPAPTVAPVAPVPTTPPAAPAPVATIAPAPTVQTGSCGKVSAPPEQVAQAYDRSYCHYVESIRPDETTPNLGSQLLRTRAARSRSSRSRCTGYCRTGCHSRSPVMAPVNRASRGLGPGIVNHGSFHRTWWERSPSLRPKRIRFQQVHSCSILGTREQIGPDTWISM